MSCYSDVDVKKQINSLKELHKQCEQVLKEKIGLLISYIEDNGEDCESMLFRGYKVSIEDFMNSYHLWVNKSLEDLENIVFPKNQ